MAIMFIDMHVHHFCVVYKYNFILHILLNFYKKVKLNRHSKPIKIVNSSLLNTMTMCSNQCVKASFIILVTVKGHIHLHVVISILCILSESSDCCWINLCILFVHMQFIVFTFFYIKGNMTILQFCHTMVWMVFGFTTPPLELDEDLLSLCGTTSSISLLSKGLCRLAQSTDWE